MTGNGIPARVMGDGEGFSTLILTDAESRLIRGSFDTESIQDERDRALEAFNRGIQRATDRIKAEFDAEARRRKDAKK